MTENPLFKKLDKLSKFEGVVGVETMVAGLILALLDPAAGILGRSIQLQIRANRLGDTPQLKSPVPDMTTTRTRYQEDADDDFSELEADAAMLKETGRFLNRLTPPDA